MDAAGLGGIAGFNEGDSLQDRATVSGLNKPALGKFHRGDWPLSFVAPVEALRLNRNARS